MESIKVGKCLRVAQEMHEVGNKELAAKLGVVPQQVNRWRNMDNMKIQQVQKIAGTFGMTLSEFIKLGGYDG